MRFALAVALTIGAACVETQEHVLPELPQSISRLLVIRLDPAGHIAHATGLHLVDDVVRLTSNERDTIVVLGYTDADLAGARLPGPEVAQAQAFRAARACEVSLPPPSWIHRVGDETAEPPRLTATWLADACDPPVSLHPVHACDEKVEPWSIEQRGCRYTVDLSRHQLGKLEGTVDPFSGLRCFESSTTPPPCVVEAAPPYSCVVEGRACTLDFEASTGPIEARLDRLRIYSSTVAPDQSAPMHRAAALEVKRIQIGYLSDLVVLEDRVVVSGYRGAYEELRCGSREFPTELIVVGLDDMEIQGRQQIGRCLQRMIADPIGRGFVATYFDDATWRIARFDAKAGLVASSSISPDATFDPWGWRVQELVVLQSGEIAVVLVTKIAVAEGAGTYVLIVDAQTLEVSAVSRFFDMEAIVATEAVGAAHVVSPHLVIGDERNDGVLWLDLDTLDISAGQPVAMLFPESARSSVTGTRFVDQQLLASAAGNVGVVHFAAAFNWDGFALPLELPGYPTSLGQWPPDPSLVLVAASKPAASQEFGAHLLRLDPEARSFVPGTIEVGFGVISRMAADERGRVWLLLPWAAELVRVTVP